MTGYGNMLGPTFGFKSHNNFNLKNIITKKICNPNDFYLPKRENFAPPHTSLDSVQNLSSDRLWTPLLRGLEVGM